MGVEQVYYDAFLRAKEYEKKRKENPQLTRRDLEMDALVEILQKKRFISCHSYVQSEINMLMHVGDSLGFIVNTFTHILEGYKVADKMKAHGASASTFADWWAYKYEVIEAIPQNAAILNKMGVVTAVNSDDAEMGRRLNQEAAKMVKYGKLSEEDAWKMVTLNPAKMLHLDKFTGSIAIGKDADLVLWSDNPLSIYAKAEMTLIDGICYYSLEKDKALRAFVNAERERLIQKMMAAKQKGERTSQYTPEIDVDYHCDTVETY
jgi:imidazolonepropionase-like amidohydrolase